MEVVLVDESLAGQGDALVQRHEEAGVGLEGQDQAQAVLGVRLVVQASGLLQEPPVPATELAQELESLGTERVRVRAQVRPQRGHELLLDGRHLGLQELRVQGVDPEFQRAHAQAHQVPDARLEREEQGAHQEAQVRQQRLQPGGDGQAELHEGFPQGVRLRALQHAVERAGCQWQYIEELVVQLLKLPAGQGLEKSAHQVDVARGVRVFAHVPEALLHEGDEPRLQDRLALREFCKRTEEELEQA